MKNKSLNRRAWVSITNSCLYSVLVIYGIVVAVVAMQDPPRRVKRHGNAEAEGN